MNENILAAIGNTPLVRLSQVYRDLPFRFYAKLESLNPGGSTKDRPALSIIQHGIDCGVISRDTVVIESSSGNMGIGLAQVCLYYNFRFICVVDLKTTTQNLNLLRVYGAEVDLVEQPDPVTGEFLQARINRVRELLNCHPNSFWSNQYENQFNSRAHHRTMGEIVDALGDAPDYLFCATSTCGTLRGCAEFIRHHQLKTKIIAVDAVGSVIFGAGQNSKRLIPGHGAAVRPALHSDDLADECVHVTDIDCVLGCRRLVRHESILAGGSSGAVVMAVEKVRHRIPDDATCVAIFPDRGERYFDTIYSDAWVTEHFGEVLETLPGREEAQACLTMTY
jgi:cysteine synthase A